MQPVILTYQDYLELPDDNLRYEIHEGQLSVTPAPTPEHKESSGDLYSAVRHYVRSRGLGRLYYAPLDVILSDTTIVQPDLVFLDNSRLGQISARGVEGPPTLVVEILSPSTSRIDRVRKTQLYAQHGVPYYWIVDPRARTIEGYRLTGEQYEPAGRVAGSEPLALPPFPDLLLDPSSIWTEG